jgi:hypothetical protein
MLLSDIDPRERLGKRVRVRLWTNSACEELPHDPAEDGRTGTLRRCEYRPGEPSHH